MVTLTAPAGSDTFGSGLDVSAAGELPGEQVLAGLGVGQDGLSAEEAGRRLARYGPNAVVTHRARLLLVLWHQLRSPLLGLLLAAAVASYFVGQRSDAVIIGVILGLSVGLGFVNEYRAQKVTEALHSQIHHRTLAIRGGHPILVDVTGLVPATSSSCGWGTLCPPTSGCCRYRGWSVTSWC
jgi:P-type Mg2+ transporter